MDETISYPSIIDLSGDDWPEQLQQLLDNDPALSKAFLRCHTMARFLSGLYGVANQLPTLDGAQHSQPADSHHVRVDIDKALAMASTLPDDMRAAIRMQLHGFRAMASAHNLAVGRWRAAIEHCVDRLGRLLTGPYQGIAETLSMQVMDRVEQAKQAEQAERAVLTALKVAAQLPDDLVDDLEDVDAVAVPVPVDDLATTRAQLPGIDPIEQLATVQAIDAIGDPPPAPVDCDFAREPTIDASADDIEHSFADVDTDQWARAVASAAVEVERQSDAPEVDELHDVAGLGAHVRRLQWTVGVISSLAAVLILSFGLMALQAEYRAEAAKTDATEAREQARESERRASLPLQIVSESEQTHFWRSDLPLTIEVGGGQVTILAVE